MLIFESDERPEVPTDPSRLVKAMQLGEKAVLQRRIKNQRRELRRLNAQVRGLDMLVRNAFDKQDKIRRDAYRHAAQMAEKFPWLSGFRIAEAIRRWI